ncbi:unnamed protein product [Auanema sp. JU1783]|nr:unnamed protein product [Auanema sp. JU1783]
MDRVPAAVNVHVDFERITTTAQTIVKETVTKLKKPNKQFFLIEYWNHFVAHLPPLPAWTKISPESKGLAYAIVTIVPIILVILCIIIQSCSGSSAPRTSRRRKSRHRSRSSTTRGKTYA